MPVWRCPHCGAPQPETARCWVCRRSTTSCVTCRHFRRAVVSALGYCGLDRRRLPLAGDELRACWEAPAAAAADAEPAPAAAAAALTAPAAAVPVRQGRDFVPVDGEPAISSASPVTSPAAPADAGATSGWSLWGDADA